LLNREIKGSEQQKEPEQKKFNLIGADEKPVL
jgi:hypothetical protein